MPEAGMNLTAFQVHKQWVVPTALVLVITGLVDCVAVWFSHRPIFWAALIGSSLPLSMTAFVLIPFLRRESRRS
jgi:hypothetical protein